MNHIEHFIDGNLVSFEEENLKVYNPASGEVKSTVSIASKETVSKAITSSKNAFSTWSTTPISKRTQVLFEFKKLVDVNINTLAKIITSEHGKTIDDAKGEVLRGLEVLEFACGIPSHLRGQFSDNVAQGIDVHSFRQPIGVTLGITPFNFPVMVPMWMFPISIACGNTFILKPSEKDPSASLFLAELFKEAGLPSGVLNVVNGNHTTVDNLMNSPEINAVSFVGSTPVAKIIFEKANKNHKRVQALGGAKNHLFVMSDADLDQASDALIGSAFGSAGERCMAISVAVLMDDIADDLIEILKDKTKNLTIDDGEKNADLGPLISSVHREKVLSYIDSGIKDGAHLIFDGRENEKIKNSKGFFLGPSIFDMVKTDMKIYQEEIFGPVLSIIRVKSFEEGLKIINNHQFANGVSIFTKNGKFARDFSRKIEVGMVGINVPIPVPVAFHSFGGWKNSIFGDYHIYGQDGVNFYTKLKAVTSRWPDFKVGAQFVIPSKDSE